MRGSSRVRLHTRAFVMYVPQLMPFGLEQREWEHLLRGLARRQYYLFLGAGASAGGLDGFGDELPLGSGLADDLIAHFEIPATPGPYP